MEQKQQKDYKKVETFKLQHNGLEFKVNEEKQVVVAIEHFIVQKPCNIQFKTVGVAKVDTSKGDKFDVETGKRIARAKAEKLAFKKFKCIIDSFGVYLARLVEKALATSDKMEDYIKHQEEYLKSF